MRRLLALACMASAVGCVLFADDDPSKLGTTCHFRGDDGDCGRCVASSCRSKVDACCSTSSCAPALALLEQCVGDSSAAGCAQLRAQSAELGACVTACASCPR
jgi:hypothetical protein